MKELFFVDSSTPINDASDAKSESYSNSSMSQSIDTPLKLVKYFLHQLMSLSISRFILFVWLSLPSLKASNNLQVKSLLALTQLETKLNFPMSDCSCFIV